MIELERGNATNAAMPLEEQTGEPAKHMVGLAGFEVSQDPNVLLCTSPLGACLAIAIYDPKVKVGGVLHSLLPASRLAPDRAVSCPGMFLDTGLKALFARARQLNATKENLRVFVAGAAQIMDESPGFNIAKSNCDMLGELLAEQGVRVYARAVGGRTNCSLELTLATGEVRVKYSGRAEPKTLCKP
jgi:chemotaxis protein CheD